MSQHPTPAGDASPSPLPPGTTHLVDLDGTMATKHANDKDVRDIVLIPRPSDDPEDPLNWSFRRKLLSTSCVVVYTMLLAIPSSAVYSVVTPIRKATGLTLTDLNNGTGIMVCLRLGPTEVQRHPTYCDSFYSTDGAASFGSRWLCNTASALPTCYLLLPIS